MVTVFGITRCVSVRRRKQGVWLHSGCGELHFFHLGCHVILSAAQQCGKLPLAWMACVHSFGSYGWGRKPSQAATSLPRGGDGLLLGWGWACMIQGVQAEEFNSAAEHGAGQSVGKREGAAAVGWQLLEGVRVVVVWVSALFLVSGCEPGGDAGTYQGYIEAEYVYVASPQAGELKALAVERGQEVELGQPLFKLDPEPEAALRREAVEKLKEAQARLEDLRKGKRPSELAALEAKVDQAKVSLELAELEFRRVEKLFQEKVVPVEDLDRVRATLDLSKAQLAEQAADLETARLGGRADAIQAAEAAVAAGEAVLRNAEWSLAQKSQLAPAKGLVHDTLYRPGEWVAGGRPVVVLLPPANLKVRFFAPQEALARLAPGVAVRVTFDGAPQPYAAKVSYVSTQAEFTPPVIYSQQTRAKLVFMIEAKFETGDTAPLRPGQPVDVRLVPGSNERER